MELVVPVHSELAAGSAWRSVDQNWLEFSQSDPLPVSLIITHLSPLVLLVEEVLEGAHLQMKVHCVNEMVIYRIMLSSNM